MRELFREQKGHCWLFVAVVLIGLVLRRTYGSATDFIPFLTISVRIVGSPKTRVSSPGLGSFFHPDLRVALRLVLGCLSQIEIRFDLMRGTLSPDTLSSIPILLSFDLSEQRVRTDVGVDLSKVLGMAKRVLRVVFEIRLGLLRDDRLRKPGVNITSYTDQWSVLAVTQTSSGSEPSHPLSQTYGYWGLVPNCSSVSFVLLLRSSHASVYTSGGCPPSPSPHRVVALPPSRCTPMVCP